MSDIQPTFAFDDAMRALRETNTAVLPDDYAPPKIYATYVRVEKYDELKKFASEALGELERINKIMVINNSVIANLKNVLV